MKKVLLIIMLILISIPYISAPESVTGYVKINIKNDPPAITGLAILEPYKGIDLFCDADVEDEIKDVRLSYEWYKNNVLLSEDSAILESTNFDKDDIITCKVVPNDLVQNGEAEQVSVKVMELSFKDKVKRFIGKSNAVTWAITMNSTKDYTYFNMASAFILLLALILIASVIFQKIYK